MRGELSGLIGPDQAYRVEHMGFLGAPDSRAHTGSVGINSSQVERIASALLRKAKEDKVNEFADSYFPRGSIVGLPERRYPS